MNDQVEYSADYDFFRENQVAVAVLKNGTYVYSRLDGSRFITMKRRTLPDETIEKLVLHVHREICNLKFGGTIVD